MVNRVKRKFAKKDRGFVPRPGQKGSMVELFRGINGPSSNPVYCEVRKFREVLSTGVDISKFRVLELREYSHY